MKQKNNRINKTKSHALKKIDETLGRLRKLEKNIKLPKSVMKVGTLLLMLTQKKRS